MDATDWSIIQELQKGIPLCPRPYREIAGRCALAEDEVLRRVRALCEEGVIRRLGARLGHIRAGITGNILVAWHVPEQDVNRVGEALATVADISHCYQRRALPDFPYNLYTMVHAPTPEQAMKCVEKISQSLAVTDYVTLPTLKELKKSSPCYAPPGGNQ